MSEFKDAVYMCTRCDRQQFVQRMSNVCFQTTGSRRTPKIDNGHTTKENISTVYPEREQSLISFPIVFFTIAFLFFQ